MKSLTISLIIFMVGCSEVTPEIKPIKEAYNDGFEVIVIDENDAIYSKKLKDIGPLINDGATFILDINEIDYIKSELEKNQKQSTTSNYPFVGIYVNPLNSEDQEIILSYHYSKSTYFYKYQAYKNKVIPIESGYRDLSMRTLVTYE